MDRVIMIIRSILITLIIRQIWRHRKKIVRFVLLLSTVIYIGYLVYSNVLSRKATNKEIYNLVQDEIDINPKTNKKDDVRDYLYMVRTKYLWYDDYYDKSDPLHSELLKHAQRIYDHSCPKNTRVLVWIMSDPSNFELRQSMRELYTKREQHNHYKFLRNQKRENFTHCFLFFTGYRNKMEMNSKLDYEALKYKDVLRVPVYDTYRSMAHKIVLGLHIIDGIKGGFDFIIKQDDDVIAKLNFLIPYLYTLSSDKIYIGHVGRYQNVDRDPDSKWYVSPQEYPNDTYPPFFTGAIYVIRRHVIPEIFKQHYKSKFIPMEDVHISNLFWDLNLPLTHEKYFKYCEYNLIDYCLHTLIVGISRNQTLRLQLMEHLRNYYA